VAYVEIGGDLAVGGTAPTAPLDRLYRRRILRAADSLEGAFGQNIFVPVTGPANDSLPEADGPGAAPAGPRAAWRTTLAVATISAALWTAIIAAASRLV